MQLLEQDGGSNTDHWQPHGEPLRLNVVRLLGTGGVNEVHEVQQLPAGSDPADTVRAAGCELGGCSIGRQRMALKLPLRHAEMPAENKGIFNKDGLFYAHASQLLLAEHKILTTLAGKHGITRSYGYGIPTFTSNGHDFEVRGLLLELCELGSLQQQLVPEDGVYVPMSAGEAREMMVSVACALKAVHVDAKHVFEDLKPANICLTKASGKLEFKLIDFSSCQPLLAPNNITGLLGWSTQSLQTPTRLVSNAALLSLSLTACWCGNTAVKVRVSLCGTVYACRTCPVLWHVLAYVRQANR
jgi:serine/threonine protein kinase